MYGFVWLGVVFLSFLLIYSTEYWLNGYDRKEINLSLMFTQRQGLKTFWKLILEIRISRNFYLGIRVFPKGEATHFSD